MIRRYYENKNIKINTYLMQKLIDFEKDIYSNNSKKKIPQRKSDETR